MYVKSIFPSIEKINDIPLVGGFILIIFSALPGAFLTLYSEYFSNIEDNQFIIIAFSSYVVWNFLLMKIGIKIYLFFVPAWIFWAIVSVLVLGFGL